MTRMKPLVVVGVVTRRQCALNGGCLQTPSSFDDDAQKDATNDNDNNNNNQCYEFYDSKKSSDFE